jgi:hypothetical protein
MNLKILAIEEGESLIDDISKFTKSKIKVFNIKLKEREMVMNSQVELLPKELSSQIEKINKIKNNYDLCFVSSWNAAKLAYLCDLNYIIWFIGNDIRIPPFVKESKPKYFNEPVNQLSFIERKFYKKVFDNAVLHVTVSKELFQYLEKFSNKSIRIDRVVVDSRIFNSEIKPANIIKKKFTFFSPQRMGVEKGTEILWEAIKLAKTDFEVIQIEWYDDKSFEAQLSSENLKQNIPEKIKLIPPVKKENITKYYTLADAVLGELKTGHTNSIEREASLCKKAVLCFNDINQKTLLNGNEIETPFLPKSQEPKIIAELIDKIVTLTKFREDLAKKEYDFMKELCDPYNAANEWDNIFHITYEKYKKIDKNTSYLGKKMKKIFFYLITKFSTD